MAPSQPAAPSPGAPRDSRAAPPACTDRGEHPLVPPDVPRGPGRRRPRRHLPAPRVPGRPARGTPARRTRPPGPLGKNPQGQHHPAHMTATEIATHAPACTQAGLSSSWDSGHTVMTCSDCGTQQEGGCLRLRGISGLERPATCRHPTPHGQLKDVRNVKGLLALV
jgi:hypothetical protein